MKQEIENEYKFMLGKESFLETQKKCEEIFSDCKTITQLNYYFDTMENYYASIGQTIRIRQIESVLKLQIKKHQSKERSYNISEELTQSITALPLQLTSTVLEFNTYLKGSMTTIRKKFSFGEKNSICFDINMYLGVCDYEIEIEFASQDKAKALALIEMLGLQVTICKNKSYRFFERLEMKQHE